MKISLRIAVPIVAALVVSGAIGLTFLWQIHASVSAIESSFQGQGGTMSLLKNILPGSDATLDTGIRSQALLDLRQGEMFEMRGLWQQAEERYRSSVENGGGVPALRKLAALQMQRRKYDDAEHTISRLRDENSDNDIVMLFEGILALRKGDASRAENIFKKKAGSPHAEYGLGLTALSRMDHEGAKMHLAQAMAGNDPIVRTYAKTLLDAYAEFALFPEGQKIHLLTLLGRALAEANECETALPLLYSVTAEQSRYRDAWVVKGYCEFTTERLPESLASLEQAYAIDPEKPEIQYFLARSHDALGDPQNAVTFLQYALVNGFEPEKEARNLLAEYALELGNTALALEQYKILAEATDSDLASYEKYVDLAMRSADHTLDAFAMAKDALVRFPDEPDALALAAGSAFAAGLPDDATKYLTSALRIDPKNAKALAVQEAMKKNINKPQ